MRNECLKIAKLEQIKNMVRVKFLKSNITMLISEGTVKEKVKNGFWILNVKPIPEVEDYSVLI